MKIMKNKRTNSKDTHQEQLEHILSGLERLVMVLDHNEKEAVKQALNDNLSEYLESKSTIPNGNS